MKKPFNLAFFCLFILLVGTTVRGQKPLVESFLPILGNYADKSVPLGGSSTISPDTGASGIGTATVSVSGRVLTANGSGIGNAIVTLTDTSGNVFTKRTNTFGNFRFDEISVGETYIISADSKRFTFNPASQVLMVNDELTDVSFIANE